ncbi:ABC-three component system middle component 1 [Salinibacillus xinjiangensis]|uniref:Uncharacterized protein n=1 Tax=Salinibacillus xinjiangensis TaxID=1229268 RepID=A0A6G1XAE3_9BACI|nr:ABC-three component system middle component 1 [Salinibacillus xinjiangensis]MRG87912.1 hypothetical protein [Salinibacillus xinjiangensis]
MFLNKYDVIKRIKHESGNNSFDLVECLVKSETNYNVYIFTMIINDQDELMEHWKEISGDIAVHFQGELVSDIEIWNIYILFLVQGSVDNDIRYLIEQNKYSSRKLVIENVERPIGTEDIENIINEKLFNVNVESVGNANPPESIFSTLESKYGNLIKVIKDGDHEKPSVLFTKYLELLKNEL